ncbi:MAG TPA: hypothetical protein VKB93_24375 [Thermoanaerobaculia bacterium]|nr:hypothetical protein [Thermoanaerobaculia bacterium]
MSVVKSSITRNAEEAATDTPMLTPEQLVEQLRVLRQQIPEFVQLADPREIKQFRRLATVQIDFAREGIGVVGASPVVQEAIGNTAEDLHHAEDEIARWTVAESELRSMLRGVAAANLVRRHRIGLAGVQAYNVSRQLVRQEEHAHRLPHVQRMSQVRKFGRRRAKRADPQPLPQPRS